MFDFFFGYVQAHAIGHGVFALPFFSFAALLCFRSVLSNGGANSCCWPNPSLDYTPQLYTLISFHFVFVYPSSTFTFVGR